MTGVRRRWLYAAVAVLAVVLLVVVWSTIQTERGDDASKPVASTTPLAGQGVQGVQGGTTVSPSNTLGGSEPASVPSPELDVGSGAGSPIDPWWRRVPPVAGDLVPIDRYAAGHVRITRTGEHLFVTIEDLRVASYDSEVSSVRVLLSEGAVAGVRRGYWTQQGDDEDLGTVPADVGTITFDIESPRGLPDEVRSVVLLDPDSGEILGGAALIPTD